MQLYDIDESKGYPIPVIVPDDLGGYYLADEVDTEIAALKDRLERAVRGRDAKIKELEAENTALRKALDRYKKYYVTRTALKACESLRDEYALRIEMLSTPNTKEWLMARGYDGLYTEDCGCLIADLAPCGEGTDSCCPGYRQEENPEGYDFFIGPTKAALGQKEEV